MTTYDPNAGEPVQCGGNAMRQGGEVADVHGVDGGDEQSAGAAGGAGLGHTNSVGLRPETDGELKSRIADEAGHPAFPPGPEDEIWSHISQHNPSLEPAICRMANDELMRNRLDRLRALGNGVVPQQAAYAITQLLDRIKGFEVEETR